MNNLTGRHSQPWYRREAVPTVSLALTRRLAQGEAAAQRPTPPAPLLTREQMTLAMEMAGQRVAAIFPGTRIRLGGVLRPIRT